MKLRVGIAGYGVVGKRRRVCIDQNSSLEMVAVCDQAFPSGISSADGIRSYNTYKELFKENLDIL